MIEPTSNQIIMEPTSNQSAPVAPAGKSSRSSFWGGFFVGVATVFVLGIIGIVGTLIVSTLFVSKSLDVARESGSNAAIKGALTNMRAFAEIEYDKNNSFMGVCSADTVANSLLMAKRYKADADVVCFADADSWAAGATYVDEGKTQTFCVNSMGASASLSGKASDLIKDANFPCQ